MKKKKKSHKPKLRDILQNTWPVLFKSLKVMSVQEKLRNYHRLEETNVIRQLNSMWDSGLDCRRKRTLVGKPMKSKPTLLFSEEYCINVNFFISPTVLWYFNTRGKVGDGYMETLYYFCNSSISLKLAQNKRFKNTSPGLPWWRSS